MIGVLIVLLFLNDLQGRAIVRAQAITNALKLSKFLGEPEQRKAHKN
jgi:hypothetical protein